MQECEMCSYQNTYEFFDFWFGKNLCSECINEIHLQMKLDKGANDEEIFRRAWNIRRLHKLVGFRDFQRSYVYMDCAFDNYDQ